MTEITVSVIFFAQARELAKLKKTTVRLPQTLFGHELRNNLINQFNLLSIGNVFVLAINENYVSDDLELTLQENDIVAVIPPISGGNNLQKCFKVGSLVTKVNFCSQVEKKYDRFKNFELRTRHWLCN